MDTLRVEVAHILCTLDDRRRHPMPWLDLADTETTRLGQVGLHLCRRWEGFTLS